MAQLKIRYGGADAAVLPLILESATVTGFISAGGTTSSEFGAAYRRNALGTDAKTISVDSSVDQTLEIILQADATDEIVYHDRKYLGLRDVLVELLTS